jgi:poly(ADP-ribose) glycohydrolase ARH3
LDTTVERFKGCLLGLALGDAVGSPFEGSYCGIKTNYNQDLPEVFRYTDDTEMAIGVAESLTASYGFNSDDMARRFAGNFDPFRGYGRGTAIVLNLINNGMHWQDANTLVFREGSFGNGAAMRVAPLGLFYSNDVEVLREKVEEASSITHCHVLGKEGAVILAFAISLIIRTCGELTAMDFLDNLVNSTDSEEYSTKLRSVKDLLEREASLGDVVRTLGNSILALESVPTAIYSFLKYGHNFIRNIEFCIFLGGDTDTIGAMAGALSGCLIGSQSLPEDWLLRLENAEKGRDYISNISEELFRIQSERN